MTKRASKEKVIKAAINLFNVKGFSGTSVRDIANDAGCNVALISYYFRNKQGLLEHLITSFLERYIEAIEIQVKRAENEEESAYDCLLKAIWDVMLYQQNKHQLARFVHREITLDTVLVRELMTTYLAKEKHLYHTLVQIGYENGEMDKLPNEYFELQLRGMLIMPFLHPQYIREVYHLMPHEGHFLDQYFSEIANWVAIHFNDDITSV
ncbi:forespore capture DNA-binding protein RefZ [Evansella cellulosilytica]|uniref:Regulatory protein TetR n=1 Tax=Evansella cellulosilytica (strain ATCC 21833 / DSM 2522 / FERM P-1141 / JCM 9156 / N-4) TaxID=649639 RepID=E6U156_EVAC2|nr:forespore capture DNA-binding protein RefZ [Evansella cellulosilytica]ADU31502.1 regulatory protein TetR [Evansella cellulosilytica DSM 2522]